MGPAPAPTSEAMSALLQATVTVVRGSRRTGCAVLQPRQDPIVHVGDWLQFVANEAPDLSAHGRLPVRVSTAPGPTTTAGGPGTPHLVITLTATRPGMVSVTWIDCTGVVC